METITPKSSTKNWWSTKFVVNARRFILGSRSPQRLDLLSQIIPRDRILVVLPNRDDEPSFDRITECSDIEAQQLTIVRRKRYNVIELVRDTGQQQPVTADLVICADTVIVATDGSGLPCVLGKPPASDWQNTTRSWFRKYLSGRTHTAMTSVSIGPTSPVQSLGLREFTVRTRVTFSQVSDALLEWYLRTGEPKNKAGAYGIQGSGSLFVERVEGSISNVIGLPLREVWQALVALGAKEIFGMNEVGLDKRSDSGRGRGS